MTEKVTISLKQARFYGLTEADLMALYDEHEGQCHACRQNPATDIEHDRRHCSDKYPCGLCVRGVTCHSCNSIIGKAKDNPEAIRKKAQEHPHLKERLLRIAEYLEKGQQAVDKITQGLPSTTRVGDRWLAYYRKNLT